MAPEENSRIEDARTAASESIPALLASADEKVLRALIENPSLDETHLCLLLERKDLPGTLLDAIAKRKNWRTNYRVRRALAGHPHTPRLAAMRLLRDLHLMDLVRISLLPASPVELRRLARNASSRNCLKCRWAKESCSLGEDRRASPVDSSGWVPCRSRGSRSTIRF